MTPRSPKFWSLTSLLAAVLAVIAAVAVTVVLTADGDEPDSDNAQIIAATQVFFEANAAGDLPALTQVTCDRAMATFPGFPEDRPAKELRGVGEIVITGDTATGSVLVSEPAQPDLGSALLPMAYVNDDGWKLCPPTS